MPVPPGKRRRLESWTGCGDLHGDAAACDEDGKPDMEQVYFDSYGHAGIHEDMIKDRTRTEAYREAIEYHADLIWGKVVVDVGCGTGILSVFCARAGARHVYAIDASGIADTAREIVRCNGLDSVITVIKGRVEDVEIEGEVDVIVSEWMGYSLLYESMLRSVICARDKWLKPGGLMLPSQGSIYLAPITHTARHEESVDFWKDVYGIDMSPMIPIAKKEAFFEPSVEPITGEQVLTWPSVIARIDCATVTAADIERVSSSFSVSSMMMGPLSGFALWFDVVFGPPAAAPEPARPLTVGNAREQGADILSGNLQRAEPEASPLPAPHSGMCAGSSSTPVSEVEPKNGHCKPIRLTTAPEGETTHWLQTVLYLDDPIEVQQDQLISGAITLASNAGNSRLLDIYLDFKVGDVVGKKVFVMR